MFKSKISPSLICLASICLLLPITQEAKADSLNFNTSQFNSYSIAQRFSRLRFRLPNRGVPGARIGGATRSAGNKVTAIIPEQKLGLTASNSPTIFVYIPENESETANLTLMNQQGQQIYTTSFDVPSQAGILRIKLPETVELETSEMYQWQVQLNSSHSSPIMGLKLKTVGWLEKVALTTTNSTQEEDWSNLNTLAEAGIWHDTLEQLAIMRLENPEDIELQTEWNDLLNSVGLDKISQSDLFPEIIEVN